MVSNRKLPKRHQKKPKLDPLRISKGSFKRLALQAGIPRVAGVTYPKLQDKCWKIFKNVLEKAAFIADNAGRKTISAADMRAAMENRIYC